MSSTLSALRAATAEIHQALHHHRVLAPLGRAGLCGADYRRALTGLFGFHTRAWQILQEFPELRPLVTPTPAWLAQDLEALGTVTQRLPLPAPLTAADCAAALGILYVKEGSLLGGRQLAKAVRGSLGPAAPCRHFDGLGDATGGHWRAVHEHLQAAPAGESSAICAAACASFTCLEEWLDHLAAATF